MDSFGGGLLFRSLAQPGLVDGVEVAVIPVLLGRRIPLLPPPANQIKLKLTGHKARQGLSGWSTRWSKSLPNQTLV
jgi:dihydrofolate reductase